MSHAYSHLCGLLLMAPSASTGWAELGLRDPSLGTFCPGEGTGRSRRSWGVGGPLNCRPVSGSPDLEDMSVMVLWTQGPLLFSTITHLSSTPPAVTPSGHSSSVLVVSSCPSCPAEGGLSFPTWGERAGSALAPGLPWGSEEEESDERAPEPVGWHPWHSRASGSFTG